MKRQSGFAHNLVFLVIALAITVGGVGYYVWRHNHPKVTAPAASSQTPSSNARLVKFSTLPSKLKQAITAQMAKTTPACVKNGELVNVAGKIIDPQVAYDSAGIGAAIATIGCDGGEAGLFATDITGAKWSFVEMSSSEFKCSSLEAHGISPKLLQVSQGSSEAPHCLTDANISTTYNQIQNS